MYILFGILGAIVSMLIQCICEALFNFDVLNLYAKFIPAGGLIFGFLIGWFIYKGVKLSNKKFDKSILIVSSVLLAVTFVGIFYVDYKTTYITGTDGNYSYNHKFEGEPISNFVYESNGEEERLTFVNYFKLSMETSKLRYRSLTLNTTGTINYILTLVNLVLMVIAGSATVYGVKKCIYCDACNKYHRSKKVFQVNENDISEIIENGEIVNDIDRLKQFISNHKKKYRAKDIYLGTVTYCPNCNSGNFIVTHVNTEGRTRVERSITVNLDNSMIPYLMA